MFFLSLALLAETSGRRMIKYITKKITGSKEKNKFSFGQEMTISAMTTIPVVSQLVGVAVYRGDAIPVLGGFRDVATGSYGMIKGKKSTTKKKGAVDLAEGIATVRGVAGAGQISKILKDLFNAGESKNRIAPYHSRINNRREKLRLLRQN